MPHSQINGPKISTMNPGVEEPNAVAINRGYLGKGTQAGLWRETRFNSSNGVNTVIFLSVFSTLTALSFMCPKLY